MTDTLRQQFRTCAPDFCRGPGIWADLFRAVGELGIALAEAADLAAEIEGSDGQDFFDPEGLPLCRPAEWIKDRLFIIRRNAMNTPLPSTKADFALVWEVYPRKVARHAAERVWNRLAPSDVLVNTMLDAIAAQSRSRQWKDPDYIPFLCNWLDDERWEDQVQAVSPLSTKGQENLVAAHEWIARRRAAAGTVDAEAIAVELQEASDAA